MIDNIGMSLFITQDTTLLFSVNISLRYGGFIAKLQQLLSSLITIIIIYEYQLRNHLGLEERPTRPPNNAAAAIRAEYKMELSEWLERKHTCVSSIYESVQGVPEALEIVEQYIREKEILPANNPNKEVSASKLIERLIVRFRGEIQDELGDLNKKFTHFIIQPDEKVCTGINRLNGIIQKLTQLG